MVPHKLFEWGFFISGPASQCNTQKFQHADRPQTSRLKPAQEKAASSAKSSRGVNHGKSTSPAPQSTP
jgi:hypothetical protein